MAKKKSAKKAVLAIAKKYAIDGSLADIEDLNPSKKKVYYLKKATKKKATNKR